MISKLLIVGSMSITSIYKRVYLLNSMEYEMHRINVPSFSVTVGAVVLSPQKEIGENINVPAHY